MLHSRTASRGDAIPCYFEASRSSRSWSRRHGKTAFFTLLLLFLALLITVRTIIFTRLPRRELSTSSQLSDDFEPAQYVESLIGTLNGGHVFAGSSTPYGSVKVVADSDSPVDGQPGYVSNNSPIFGISQTHDDGTGGSNSLGHFGLLPQLCSYSAIIGQGHSRCLLAKKDRSAPIIPDSARTSPGFFSLQLRSGIDIRLTSTDHVALHSYQYPAIGETNVISKDMRRPSLLLDVTTDLQGSFSGKGKLDISLDKNSSVATLKASGKFRPSFGDGYYTIHMCASVAHVSRVGIFAGSNFTDNLMTKSGEYFDGEMGALIELDERSLNSANRTLQTRVGVSWKSKEQACRYAQEEIPDWQEQSSFERIRLASRARWNQIMGETFKPSLKGVSLEQRISVYSALYRVHLAPYNVTGDNPLWESSEPYWDSFYCAWDSFRTTNPLMTIMRPDTQAEQVRALIDIYRHVGFLPDCRMSNCKGLTQGGSNADTILADSFVKGIRKGIDWEEGLKAMIKDAEVNPEDWGLEGRGGIEARRQLGYVPQLGKGDDPPGRRVVIGRSTSRTVEYAFNDHGIALVAAGLNKTDIYKDFIKRSEDSFNLWNPDRTFEDFTGFINARFTNGTFSLLEDVRKCSPAYLFGECYLMYKHETAQFYEGSSYEYSFYLPQDMARLVKLMGGDASFIRRLNVGWDREYIDIGDEMGFLPNFQYNYAVGGYRHTVDRSLHTLHRYFNNSYGGVAGNDDAGAMGAYIVFTALGMFPVAGTAVYLLSTPLFPSYEVTSLVTGKVARLTTQGFDGATKNKYIQQATLDGRPFTRNWINHEEFFLNGGHLHLQLGSTPTVFGNTTADLPPSLSTGGFTVLAGKGL
ncbi:hypothetical protein CBS101457_005573 [Exobasidium rhododendri]|nr:hypothetical protein CBS101457_005573 [Exobasidium rhododendri]